jgi:carboxyl-terminal processing protease
MHQNIYSNKNIINFSITLLLLALYGFDVSANVEPAKFKNLKKFYEVLNLIDKQYVEEPDQKKITDAAIGSMTSSLDPHSAYLTKEDMQDFMTEIDGKFGGVGIEMTQEDGYIKVIAPIDDLAADKAGIKSGDYIISVNDEQVQELGFYKAAKNIRGAAGTKVKLKILRQGLTHPLEMTLTRGIVEIKSVKHNIDNNIGYIRISIFNKNTTKELKKALDELKKIAKLEGMILDLRNNPGGLLDQSIKVSEFFINSG